MAKLYLDTLEELIYAIPNLKVLQELHNGLHKLLTPNTKSSNLNDEILKKEINSLNHKITIYQKAKAELERKLNLLSHENVQLSAKIDALNKEINNWKEYREGHHKTKDIFESLMEETKRKGEMIRNLNSELYDLRQKEARLSNAFKTLKQQGIEVPMPIELLDQQDKLLISSGINKKHPIIRLFTMPIKKQKSLQLGNSDSESDASNDEPGFKKMRLVPGLDIERVRSDSFYDHFVSNESSSKS